MTLLRATFRSAAAIAVAFFVGGVVVGVYLQHKWPIGRWRNGERAVVQADVAKATLLATPANRRVVIVAAGQSNAANYGSTRVTAGPGVYAFADGKFYPAADPLPGADGVGGAIWTRLGARMIHQGYADAVIIAATAQGSTRITDWIPGGRCFAGLATTLEKLSADRLTPDFIFWQQGETEAWSRISSGREYTAALRALIDACRRLAPTAVVVVARSTFAVDVSLNEQVRLAQQDAGNLGAIAGPDLDQLTADFRTDGVHFNDRGLAAAADMWLEALRPHLATRLAKAKP